MFEDKSGDRVLGEGGSLSADETIPEVVALDVDCDTIEQADLQLMRRAIVTTNRMLERLKQELQQLRGQVQRDHTAMKAIESRVGRR